MQLAQNSMAKITLIKTLPVANTLGECVVWNPYEGAVWWTDIQERQLFCYRLNNDKLKKWSLPDRLCSFAFTNEPGWLLCAFAQRLALYHPAQSSIHWLAKPEKHLAHTRFNDGKTDRQGRFWVGTMVEKETNHSELGSLYCLDNSNRCIKKDSGIYIPNSLCWSPDGSRMYFSDSPTQTIYQYDFDGNNASLGNKQVFAKTPAGFSPDGSTVDADGYLWNAQWGGSRIIRYAPDGQVDLSLEIPCSQPTSCCFGGPGMQYLFVTSARDGLNDDELRTQPEAGNLFIFSTAYTGLPDARFTISGEIEKELA